MATNSFFYGGPTPADTTSLSALIHLLEEGIEASQSAETAAASAQTSEEVAASAAVASTGQADLSTAQAILATTQAGLATTAKTAAEAARDAVNTTGKVFSDTATGIAGTTNGQTFAVLATDLKSWIIYKNNSGTAVEVARSYTKAYIDSTVDTTYDRAAYVYGVMDDNNRMALGVDKDGKVIFGKGGDIVGRVAAVEQINDTTTPSRSGYVWGVRDQNDAIAVGLDPAGHFLVKGRNLNDALATTDSVSAAIVGISKWITPTGLWSVGDSLTQGAGGTPYPQQLSALLGKPVTNMGIGGQTSTQIAGRFGGVVPFVTVQNNTIPASGSVAVTAISSTIHNNQGPGVVTGTLAGIKGTLNATSFDGLGQPTVHVFTRSVAGPATVIDAATPFIVDVSDLRDFGTALLWLGRNNAGDGVQIKKDIAACVEFMKTQDKRFVVMSVINGSGEGVGTGGYSTITQLNDDLKALYPRNYLDVRGALVRSYNAGVPQDVTDHNNDIPPSSLRVDAIHLNTAGYGVVAATVFNFLTSKGWLV